MSDTDRLAALLHAEDCWPDCGNPKEVPAGTLFHRMAARLIAAGVTLAATPAPLDCGHDLVGIRLRGYREGRAEALGDVREFVDESHDRAVAYAKETT